MPNQPPRRPEPKGVNRGQPPKGGWKNPHAHTPPKGKQPAPRRPPSQPPRQGKPVVWEPPPIRNSVPFTGIAVGGGTVGLIIVVLLALLGNGDSGGSNADSSKKDDKPAVSIEGALPCKRAEGDVHLNTDERLKTCGEAKKYAKEVLVKKFGKDGEKEFGCLDQLWTHESAWSAWAKNSTTGAYGIAQILPESHGSPVKMGDWKGQVDWGLEYIYGPTKGRYRTPCNAWAFWQCTSNCSRYPGGPVGKLGGPGDPMRNWY